MYRLLLLCALLSACTLRSAAHASVVQRCFTDIPTITACLDVPFVGYWEANGGLPVFGYSLTGTNLEQNVDLQRPLITQWTERNRLEIHPENPAPYNILLGRMGDERLRQLGRNPADEEKEAGPQPGCLWFDITKHNVCDQGPARGFRAFWQSHGLLVDGLDTYNRSLQLFGLPLTAAHMERNEAGDTVLTQWFERARFEWHPTQPAATRVLLGRLGSEAFNLDGATGHATSGITGLITIGPTCPVARPGHPCADQPFQATVSVENVATQQRVTEVSSGQDGHFVLGLAPGNYTLHSQPLQPGTYPRANDVSVVVVANQFSDVAIHFDSGIR